MKDIIPNITLYHWEHNGYSSYKNCSAEEVSINDMKHYDAAGTFGSQYIIYSRHHQVYKSDLAKDIVLDILRQYDLKSIVVAHQATVIFNESNRKVITNMEYEAMSLQQKAADKRNAALNKGLTYAQSYRAHQTTKQLLANGAISAKQIFGSAGGALNAWTSKP